MVRGLTNHEKFLRRVDSLALSTLPVPDGFIAAAPKHHDGVMVALVPDDPEDLAVEDEEALPADDLHVTLCYLGKTSDLDSFKRTEVLRQTQKVCDEVGKRFSAKADGVVVMGSDDRGVPATALLIQSDEIVGLYDALSEALNYESKYPSFIPHMTTGYGVDSEKAQELLGTPIEFNNVVVKFGDEKHVIPLNAALVAAPRGANIIDRVIDSLGRLWDEALHPRGDDGKFIKKNGAVSGKLSVPTPDRKGVTTVDANRANVVGFHTFDNDVWVLAEITNPDGSKIQGFARADQVHSAAPVKARLDALYPVDNDAPDALPARIERNRQADLLLAHINREFLSKDDEDGAYEFMNSLGLREEDLDYMFSGEEEESKFGVKIVSHDLSPDELDEVEDIIEDARHVKELRDRVHGLKEDAGGFSAPDSHTVPVQRFPSNDPSPEVVSAIRAGEDPLSLNSDQLVQAMAESGRFTQPEVSGVTGISEIEWFIDENDQTGVDVYLAGTGTSTTGRAFFVKKSNLGAEFNNTDIVREVMSSLIAEQLVDVFGEDDDRLIPIPKSVFGDNPVWDGGKAEDLGPLDTKTHQPGYVIQSHAAYAVPSDWKTTNTADEETKLVNDIRNMDEFGKADAIAAHKEDMGDIYGNSVAQMIIWDYVTLNADRNPNNAVLASPGDGYSEGKALPIDHGFAFADKLMEDMYGTLDEAKAFDVLMGEDQTQGWLEYVLGGLDLENNVTEASLRKIVSDAVDVYGSIDTEEIVERLRSMPNVSPKQLERAERELAGVARRIQWLTNNADQVLRRLTTR